LKAFIVIVHSTMRFGEQLSKSAHINNTYIHIQYISASLSVGWVWWQLWGRSYPWVCLFWPVL